MVGKVPNLEPVSSGVRASKTLRVYWSPFFQRWIAKSGNRNSGTQTQNRRYAQAGFTAAVRMIKNVSPQDVQAAEDMSRNTPFLGRDLKMKAASGTLLQWIDDSGVTWVGRRQVYPDIQAALDAISNVVGTMLVRTTEGWLGLLPGNADDVLTINADNALPSWQPNTGGGGSQLNAWSYSAQLTSNHSENFATRGNIITPQVDCKIHDLAALGTLVTGATYRMGIAEIDHATLKLIEDPSLTNSVTVAAGAANTSIMTVLATDKQLTGGHYYYVFLQRTDATPTTAMVLNFTSGLQIAPNFLMPNTGTAYKIASQAIHNGDTIISEGGGVNAIFFTYRS